MSFALKGTSGTVSVGRVCLLSYVEADAAIILDRCHWAGLLNPGRKRKRQVRIPVAQSNLDGKGWTHVWMDFDGGGVTGQQGRSYLGTSSGQLNGNVQSWSFGSQNHHRAAGEWLGVPVRVTVEHLTWKQTGELEEPAQVDTSSAPSDRTCFISAEHWRTGPLWKIAVLRQKVAILQQKIVKCFFVKKLHFCEMWDFQTKLQNVPILQRKFMTLHQFEKTVISKTKVACCNLELQFHDFMTKHLLKIYSVKFHI